jgi:hypothetical protein
MGRFLSSFACLLLLFEQDWQSLRRSGGNDSAPQDRKPEFVNKLHWPPPEVAF